MQIHKRIPLIFSLLLLTVFANAQSPQYKTLQKGNLKLVWQRVNTKWILKTVAYKKVGRFVPLKQPSGLFTLLYSAQKPSMYADPVYKELLEKTFIKGVDNANSKFDKVLNPVSLNTAGMSLNLVPDEITIDNSGANLIMNSPNGKLSSHWQIINNAAGSTDVQISLVFTASKSGYYAIASPGLIATKASEIKWATIPGYFQGNSIQPNFTLAYAYGNGIPDKPVVLRDKCASTLTAIISRKDGITVAATSSPQYGRDPWQSDKNTHNEWGLGLSIMNRQQKWMPTLYYPVLGQQQSFLNAGQTVNFDFTYTIGEIDWYAMLKHAITDLYQFHTALALRKNSQSLTDRVFKLSQYLSDDSTSLWKVKDFEGTKIGGQSYLGGVVGSDKDAMKNSDYGAMWMLGDISSDTLIRTTRLPYARNFKLKQQQITPGFFRGAAIGQYYLYKSKKFTEEWGNVVEPIGLTYYTMLDIGNILLFEPNDKVLQERLRIGADKLLKWQHQDGSFEVAYGRTTEKPAFTDVKDYRSTFYGLLVAYKILKDAKYLAAAKAGADWYLREGVNKGYFLGVCGDARYVPDFATGQTAQAYLDLYDITHDTRYKNAAVLAAKIYISSIYTHPIANQTIKTVNGKSLHDWQISQSGLSFEHGGNFGSANTRGPILLVSHAGMFVRMYEITHDPLFLDIARAGAIGRDAFVNQQTSVASYYWNSFDNGAGPFPHHAWWQIGWIMDYVLSEIHMRSAGQISFPRGFITPKVGPHQSYGFAAGKVYGDAADLKLYNGLVKCDNPNIEFITAKSKTSNKIYLILMNDLGATVTGNLVVNTGGLATGNGRYKLFTKAGNKKTALADKANAVNLDAYGLKVLTIEK